MSPKSSTATPVAELSGETVLASLEQVFAGDVPYDEALADISIHVAHFRKTYPKLFAVLKSPPGNEVAVLAVLDDSTIHDLREMVSSAVGQTTPSIVAAVIAAMPKVISAPAPQAAQQFAQQPVVPAANNDNLSDEEQARLRMEQRLLNDQAGAPALDSIEGMKVYSYQDWYSTMAGSSAKGQEWAVRWDVLATGGPPQSTITFTAPQGNRIRFANDGILDVERGIYKLRALAFLPPKQN